MNIHIVNKELRVQQIKVTGVASSSVFIVGDTKWITCSSVFDTPPETLIVGEPPLVPLVSR